MSMISFDIFARDRASGTIRDVGKNMDGLGGKLRSFGAASMRALGGVAIAMGGVAVAGATMGLRTAASLQQAEIAFETLLGSGEKAKAFLDDLTDFAAATPFELPGLIDASRQLIGVGQDAKSVIPTLRAWGDAAGALGLSQEQFDRALLAVTQAMAKQKVQAEELMQITEAGVPIYPLLSKALGMPVPKIQELASKGELLAKDVFPALEKQMGKDYGGAMAKQSQTLSGLWSTLMDTLNIGLADAIMPLVPILQQVMPRATAALGSSLSGIKQVVQAVADALGPMLGGALKQLGPMFSEGSKLAKAFFGGFKGGTAGGSGPIVALTEAGARARDMYRSFGETIAILGGGLRNFGAQVLPGLLKVFSALQPSVQAVMRFFRQIAPAVSSLMGTIGKFVSSLMPTLEKIARQVSAVLGPALKDIGGMLSKDVIPAIQTFLTAVQPVAQWFLEIMGGAVVGALKGLVDVVKGALNIISGLLKTVTAVIKGDWGAAWTGVKQIGEGIWQAIKGAFQVFINAGIGKAFSLGARLIRGIGTKLWVGLRSIFVKGVDAVTSRVHHGVNAVVKFFASLPGRAVGALASLGGKLVTLAAKALSRMASTTAKRIEQVIGFYRKLPGRILRGLGRVGSHLTGAGKDLVRGLINGIKAMAGRAVSAAKGVVSDAVRAAKNLLGIRSPSRVFGEIGRSTMQGLVKGLRGEGSKVQSTLGKLASTVTKAFQKRLGTRTGKSTASRFLARLSDEMAALKKSATQREKVAGKLKKAQARLEDAIKTRDDFAKSIEQSIMEFGSIANVQTDRAWVSTGEVLQQMRARVAQATKFTQTITKLRKLGLNKTTLRQLVEAGPETAGVQAAAIASGGKNAVKEMNRLNGQLRAQGKTLGAGTAQALYQAGVDAARGLVKGLRSQEKALDKAGRRLADRIIKQLRRVLRIHSPSQVMADQVGRPMAEGVVMGLEQFRPAVDSAVRGLQPSPAAPSLAVHRAVPPGAGTQQQTGPINITLQIGDRTLGELVVDPLRRAVRTRGGNVQAVLGGAG